MTHEEFNTGRPPGRPKRLNARTATAIVNTLSGGGYVTTACQFAGVAKASYQLWRRRGEAEMERVRSQGHDPEELLQPYLYDEDGKGYAVAQSLAFPPVEPFDPNEWDYVLFLFHTDKASAAAEVRNLTLIQQAAGDGAWQASAWILERRHPDKYGRRERINLEGSHEGDPITVKSIGVEELEAKIKRLAGEGDG